jgi:hypothetical protein
VYFATEEVRQSRYGTLALELVFVCVRPNLNPRNMTFLTTMLMEEVALAVEIKVPSPTHGSQ